MTRAVGTVFVIKSVLGKCTSLGFEIRRQKCAQRYSAIRYHADMGVYRTLQLPYKFFRIEDLVTTDLDVRQQTIQAIHSFLGIDEPSSPMSELMALFDGEVISGSQWGSLSDETQSELASFASAGTSAF
eukprot:979157-Prorocentrum_minimum.AAC.4